MRLVCLSYTELSHPRIHQNTRLETKPQCDQVHLKKRAKDVLDALEQNNEEMRRVQEEKTKVGRKGVAAVKSELVPHPWFRPRQGFVVPLFDDVHLLKICSTHNPWSS